MALTFTRWLGALSLGCALVTGATLREHRVLPSSPDRTPERARLTEMRRRVGVAVRRWEGMTRRDSVLAHLSARDAAPTTGPTIEVDPRLPKEHRFIVERAIRREWASLGIDSALVPVTVAVVLDTTPFAEWRGGRSGELAYDYVVPAPDATTGDRHCIAIIALQAGQLARPGSHRLFTRLVSTPKLASQLLGPCAFLARFGVPGAGIDAWLRSRSYAFASIPQWSSLPGTDPDDIGEQWRLANVNLPTSNALMWLSPEAVGCTAGRIDRCGVTLAPADGESTPPGGLIVMQPRRDQHWGPMSNHYLADLVTALGPERFGRFWRSAGAPDVALRAAAAMSLDSWTHQWAAGLLGAQRVGPSTSLAELATCVTLAGLSLVLAAWGWGRREIR